MDPFVRWISESQLADIAGFSVAIDQSHGGDDDE